MNNSFRPKADDAIVLSNVWLL